MALANDLVIDFVQYLHCCHFRSKKLQKISTLDFSLTRCMFQCLIFLVLQEIYIDSKQPVFLSLFRYYIVFHRSFRIIFFSESNALHIIFYCVECLKHFLLYSFSIQNMQKFIRFLWSDVYNFFPTLKFCKIFIIYSNLFAFQFS